MLEYADFKTKLYQPRVARGIFLSLLALVLLHMVYHMWHAPMITPMPHPPVVSAVKDDRSAGISKACNENMFGVYLPKSLQHATVKQSMLNLHVVGIMYAPDDNNSLVIIKSNSGVEASYHVGDQLPGGVLLKKIVKEGVFVEHNGILESLSLPQKQLNFLQPAQPLAAVQHGS